MNFRKPCTQDYTPLARKDLPRRTDRTDRTYWTKVDLVDDVDLVDADCADLRAMV